MYLISKMLMKRERKNNNVFYLSNIMDFVQHQLKVELSFQTLLSLGGNAFIDTAVKITFQQFMYLTNEVSQNPCPPQLPTLHK